MSVHIVLSGYWLAKAKRIGAERYAYAQGRLPHYGNVADAHESKHIAGAISECAIAKFLQVPWPPAIEDIHGGDVGGVVEVRARRVPGSGLDLAMRPHDKDDKPYVLAHVHRDDSVEAIGWLFGHEAKGAGRWNDRKCVWFVRPPYRSMDELCEHLQTA